MSEPTEVIPNGNSEAPADAKKHQPEGLGDWRSEPRKGQDDRFNAVCYTRISKAMKRSLRKLAARRGETEAQYIRDLIDWQNQVVLDGETDAEMPAPPAQTKAELQLARTVVRAMIKACRIRRPRPRDDWS